MLFALAAALAGAPAPVQAQVHGILLELRPVAAPAPEPAPKTEPLKHKNKQPDRKDHRGSGDQPQPPGLTTAKARLTQIFQGKSMPMGLLREVGAGTQLVQWARPLTDAEAQQLIADLEQDPNVLWAAPNVFEQRLQVAAPNDPKFGTGEPDQWWLADSPLTTGSRGVPDIVSAWAVRTGGDVPIAVLDTGLLIGHPDLAGQPSFPHLLPPNRFAYGYDFVTNVVPDALPSSSGSAADGNGRDPDFSDPGDGLDTTLAGQLGTVIPGCSAAESSWHGSRIAGIIGAQTDNGVDVAGINRDARVVSIRVAGRCGALVSDILDAMRWAVGGSIANVPDIGAQRARVINLSFGSNSDNCTPYQSTIDALVQQGALIVAAAGNDDNGPRSNPQVSRPARCPGVMAVGAVHRDGFKTSYSSYGQEIGLMTVGGEVDRGGWQDSNWDDGGIVTVSNDGTFTPGTHTVDRADGTSFSTPIVAGVASLMLAENPSLTLDQLVHGLRATARPHVATGGPPGTQTCQVGSPGRWCYCTTNTCGAGLLDAPAALAYARNPDPAVYGAPPVFGQAPVAQDPPDTDANASGEPSGGGSGGGHSGGVWLLGLAGLLTAAGVRRRMLLQRALLQA